MSIRYNMVIGRIGKIEYRDQISGKSFYQHEWSNTTPLQQISRVQDYVGDSGQLPDDQSIRHKRRARGRYGLSFIMRVQMYNSFLRMCSQNAYTKTKKNGLFILLDII